MRQRIKLPRIIKIEKTEGYSIQCMFNNGESRLLDFEEIFRGWKITEKDIEYPLLGLKEFKKVQLRNYTLSWPNIEMDIRSEDGQIEKHAYEIGPDTLYQLSHPVIHMDTHKLGDIIRTARISAGLTQEQLATRSGTSRFYISRIISVY